MKYRNIAHNLTLQLYPFYGNQHDHDVYSRLCQARSSGSSDGYHGNPMDNASTDGMISLASGNRGIPQATRCYHQ